MTLADVRDYIASLELAEHVYMGKLPVPTAHSTWRSRSGRIRTEVCNFADTLEQISRGYRKNSHRTV